MSEKQDTISLDELTAQYAMSTKDDHIFKREDFVSVLKKMAPSPETPPAQADQDMDEEQDKGEKKQD